MWTRVMGLSARHPAWDMLVSADCSERVYRSVHARSPPGDNVPLGGGRAYRVDSSALRFPVRQAVYQRLRPVVPPEDLAAR